MQPQDFNKVTEMPIGLGLGKLEWEIIACQLLNKHIETDTPFDTPLEHKDIYGCNTMAGYGWLEGADGKYTLSRKTLGLLWANYGKS